MERISRPITDLLDHYTVVVVGSGYGGSIAASRMARAGQRVCLLERGREWLPGDFPNRLDDTLKEVQIDGAERHKGSRSALYTFNTNRDISVFSGTGLGGTSLVNANVSIRPDDQVFAHERWPEEIFADCEAGLAEGFDRARAMLQPTPYPDSWPKLAKVEANRTAAAAMGLRFHKPDINVTFRDGLSPAGVPQKKCVLCGDCVTGCNHSSKNTTRMNYLPDAWNHGADIFCEIEVRWIARGPDGRWQIYFDPLNVGRERFGGIEPFITADVVVISAGSLGSTEILMRSRDKGLALSDQLGETFTGNGDFLGFSYNSDVEINGVGAGPKDPSRLEPVGPCIASAIDQNNGAPPDGMLIEEGVAPGAFAKFLPKAYAAAARAFGVDTDDGVRDRAAELAREARSKLNPRKGAIGNTQTYLVMAHDNGRGRLRLSGDRIRIRWPDVGDQPIFKAIEARLEQAAAALGGTYMPDPVSTDLFGNRLITVHPLGGCCMAASAAAGVVDHKSRVFSGTEGSAVHEGLYVMDGAVIPTPLGVNPLLTISALAERSCALLAGDRGWEMDVSLPSRPADRRAIPREQVGIVFSERLSGHFTDTPAALGPSPAPKQSTAAWERGRAMGEAEGKTFTLVLTVQAADLEALIADPHHEMEALGTVEAPSLSPEPMAITGGRFQLLAPDPDDPGLRYMRYRGLIRAPGGQSWWLEGVKLVADDEIGPDMWSDITRLYFSLRAGGPEGELAARGMLRVSLADAKRQLQGARGTGTDSRRRLAIAGARFYAVFIEDLLRIYE